MGYRVLAECRMELPARWDGKPPREVGDPRALPPLRLATMSTRSALIALAASWQVGDMQVPWRCPVGHALLESRFLGWSFSVDG